MRGQSGPGSWGGRRPGAGAPKGNKNALRHGRYVSDRALREALLATPAKHHHTLIRALKSSGGAIKIPPLAQLRPDNVVEHPHISIIGGSNAEQSRRQEIIRRLEGYEFFGAPHFVRVHREDLDAIERVLQHLDDRSDPEYDTVRNPGGFIREMLHQLIEVEEGEFLRCPAWPRCSWEQSLLERREAR